MAAVVEELDAEVPIEGEHPIAHFVDLMQERALGRIEGEADDGAHADAGLPRRHRSRRAGENRWQRREQICQLLTAAEG